MKSRNVLIGVAAALVGLVAVTAIGIFVAGGDDGRRAGAFASRTYVATNWVLHMEDGAGYTPMGYIKDVKGCFAKNVVADGTAASNGAIPKSVSGIAYEPCVIRFRGGLNNKFYDWLHDVFEHTATPRDFWLVRQDFNRNNVYGIHIVSPKMGRLSLPKFDAAAPNAAGFLELELRPASLQKASPCCGSFSPSSVSPTSTSSSSAAIGQFRFSMSGVNDLQYTKTVGPWSAQQTGNGLELDDLEFTLQAAKAASLTAWFNDFVLNKNNGAAQEKTATLELIAPTTLQVLMTWTFRVGLIGMEESLDPYTQVSTWTTALYVEDAAFTRGSPASPPPPPSTTTTTTTSTTTTTTPPPPTTSTTTPEAPPPTETVVPETKGPQAPAEIKASPGAEGEINVAWAPVEGVEGYLVLMATEKGGPYELVTKEPVKETEQVVTALKTGVTYYFVVHTVAGEVESENSPEASAAAG
jgi:hypothetical protein